MKWCNKCEIECEDTMETCSKCGASLSDVDVSEHEFDDMVSGDYEVLTHIYDNVEADVFAAYLDSNGIKTYVHYEGHGPYKTLLIEPGTDGTSIFVSSDQLEDAKILMEQFEYKHESLRSK